MVADVECVLPMPDPPQLEWDGLWLRVRQPLTFSGKALPKGIVKVYAYCSSESGFLPKPETYLGYAMVWPKTSYDLGIVSRQYPWPKLNGKPYVRTSLGNYCGESARSMEVTI